jgi:hypothetical protein
METSFARVIEEHLDLKHRNGGRDGVERAGGGANPEANSERADVEDQPRDTSGHEDSLWGRARDFDWGD